MAFGKEKPEKATFHNIGAISTDSLDVLDSARIGDDLSVGGSVHIGPGGVKSDGPISAEGDGFYGGDLNVKGAASFGGPAKVNDLLQLTPRPSPPGSPENGDLYYDNSGADHALLHLG